MFSDGMISPITPMLLLSGRITCDVCMISTPAVLQVLIKGLIRSTRARPSGAAIGEFSTKQFCMSTLIRASFVGFTGKSIRPNNSY